MRQKITKASLRELGIYNPYDIAKKSGSKLYISYMPADARLGGANWQVVGMDFQTNPDAPWYDWGKKTFNVWGRTEKAPQLAEALQWCKDTYKIAEWEKDPFGDYQIKGAIQKAIDSTANEVKKGDIQCR